MEFHKVSWRFHGGYIEFPGGSVDFLKKNPWRFHGVSMDVP